MQALADVLRFRTMVAPYVLEFLCWCGLGGIVVLSRQCCPQEHRLGRLKNAYSCCVRSPSAKDVSRKSTTYLATKRSPGDGNMNQDYNKGAGAKAAEALYPGSKR